MSLPYGGTSTQEVHFLHLARCGVEESAIRPHVPGEVDLGANQRPKRNDPSPWIEERSLCLDGDGAGTSVIARLFGKDEVRLATV